MGYSWVILSSVFVVTFFHLGIVKVFGVFVPEIVEQLEMSMWVVGMCCSIGISLNAILGRYTSHKSTEDHREDHREEGCIATILSSVFVGTSFRLSYSKCLFLQR